MTMPSGPSKRAMEAAKRHKWSVADAVRAAHNPALGEDASVRLGDVLDALARFQRGGVQHHYLDPMGFIEREHREGRL